MKLEIARLWERGNWDTEIVEVPFAIDETPECWERCRKYASEELSLLAKYRNCAAVLPWGLVEDIRDGGAA